MLLGIHDAAFPSAPGEDIGRGTPYAHAAADLLHFVAGLGLSGLQLGPQGATSRGDPSPYDGTLFSRNPLSIALAPLCEEDQDALLTRRELARLVAGRPRSRRVSHAYAFAAQRTALRLAWNRYRRRSARGRPARGVAALRGELERFRAEQAWWLEPDGLYAALERLHGGRDWREWPAPHRDLYARARPGRRLVALLTAHAVAVERWVFAQYLLQRQHSRLRQRARDLGLTLFADLQIGFSSRDVWARRALLLPRYVMGAPPSRTNPEGQPWNYAVLDPGRYFAGRGARPGPALRLVRARARKAFAEFDGVRLDHPHGLVCPWVYRGDEADPLAAVQRGARLFASPDLPDHPQLAGLAIPDPRQIDRAQPRHADAWVRDLDEAQVTRYGALLDVVVEEAQRQGRGAEAVACEVLSTQPYPLRRVMERHGLGRFRVTQKGDLADPRNGYRGENASPEDWIMLGNHDTPSIWEVVGRWHASGASRRQAEYLASRLLSADEPRDAWTAELARDPDALAQARFAELFVGPARNVMVFFADLFGERRRYNRPGHVGPENWSLRVPNDFRRVYERRRRQGRALDLGRAVARALRARGPTFVATHRRLLDPLERG